MNSIKYLFRLVAIVTSFLLGVGFFNAAQRLQSFFQTETATVQPVRKQETLFVPPRAVPSPLVEPTPFVVTETFPVSDENTEAEFSAEGDYYIVGDLPKEFKDFNTLSITTKSYENVPAEDNYDGVSIPPEGFITTNKQFDFQRINIAGKQIAFETETKKGISYMFVGQFIEEERIEYKTVEGYDRIEFAILKGRLTKMRDGKKAAEIEARFAEGGC
jgi:hypothetical protein